MAITTRPYLGERISLSAENGTLGTISQIDKTGVTVKRILGGPDIILSHEQADLLRMDLQTTLLRQALSLLSKVPDGYTMTLTLTDKDGNTILSEGYTQGEENRIINS